MPTTVIRMPNGSGFNGGNFGIGTGSGSSGGINICCCRICTCINLNFLTTKSGLLKVCELILASLCETLLIRFGLPYSSDIGQAFISFLTTVSCCVTTATLLLVCYVISSKTFNLVRQSLFEVAFNAWSCLCYLSASSYMAFAVSFYLYPRFVLQSAYMPYPAMTAVYYIGTLLGIIHGIDAYFAYQYFKGYR